MELKLKAIHKFIHKEYQVAAVDFYRQTVTVYLNEADRQNYHNEVDEVDRRNVDLYLWDGEKWVEVIFPDVLTQTLP